MRESRRSGAETGNFWGPRGLLVYIASGFGTYGRLCESSCDVNKRICDPSEVCSVGVESFASPYEGGSEYIGGREGVCGLDIVVVVSSFVLRQKLRRLGKFFGIMRRRRNCDARGRELKKTTNIY